LVRVRENEISFFRGSYRFLSNFYPVRVRWEGKYYPSIEHAYQAAKAPDEALRGPVRRSKTAGEAKALGRKLPLRRDWESVKFDVMLELLRQKFGHADLAELLLETEDAYLVEGNTWGDREWGVVEGKGKNHLGRLLMQVREELRKKRAGNKKETDPHPARAK
jgi:ribA/ribD-fused uncharacterized protein